MNKIKWFTLFVVLFLCGCYDAFESSWNRPLQHIQSYTLEQRIDNLERNAREMRIGKQFPDIAAKPAY